MEQVTYLILVTIRNYPLSAVAPASFLLVNEGMYASLEEGVSNSDDQGKTAWIRGVDTHSEDCSSRYDQFARALTERFPGTRARIQWVSLRAAWSDCRLPIDSVEHWKKATA